MNHIKSDASVEWSEAKNRRRYELIDREIDGTLTPDEQVELGDLQRQFERYVNKVAPLPLVPLRRLREELLQKAATAAGGSTG